MFALCAAVVFFLMAIHVSLGALNMLWLALMFLCLHLAFSIGIPLPALRRHNSE